MSYEVCIRCGYEIDKKGNFCQNCGFYIRRDFSEKELFVFRMDIIGFTGITQKVEIFDLKTNLSLLFSNLRNISEKNGGYVNQYIGDEIEIIWGLVKSFDYKEFLNFIKDIDEFFKSEALKIKFKMRMFGGYGKTTIYPIRTGIKAYLILASDFVNELNELKTLTKEEEIILLGDVEKIFPLNLLEKRIENGFTLFLLKKGELYGTT